MHPDSVMNTMWFVLSSFCSVFSIIHPVFVYMFISVTYLPKPSRLMIYGSCPLSCWNHFRQVHKTTPSEQNKSNDSLIQPPGNGSHDFDGSTKLYQRIPIFKIQHSSVPRKNQLQQHAQESGTSCSPFTFSPNSFHLKTTLHHLDTKAPLFTLCTTKLLKSTTNLSGTMEIPRWSLFWCQLPRLATVHLPQKSHGERWMFVHFFGGIMEMRAQDMTNWSWINYCMTHTAHTSYVQQTVCLFSRYPDRYRSCCRKKSTRSSIGPALKTYWTFTCNVIYRGIKW